MCSILKVANFPAAESKSKKLKQEVWKLDGVVVISFNPADGQWYATTVVQGESFQGISSSPDGALAQLGGSVAARGTGGWPGEKKQ